MDEHSYCVQQNEDGSKMGDDVHIKEEVMDFEDQISTQSQCSYGAKSCANRLVLAETEFPNSGSSVVIKREVPTCGISTTIDKGGTIEGLTPASCNEFSCVNVEEKNAEQDGSKGNTNQGWESPIHGEVQSQNEPVTVKLEGSDPDSNVDLIPIDPSQYDMVKVEVKFEDAVEERDSQQEDSRGNDDNEKDGDDNREDAQLEVNGSCVSSKEAAPELNDTEGGMNGMNNNDGDDGNDDGNYNIVAQINLGDRYITVKEILEDNHAEDGMHGMSADQMNCGNYSKYDSTLKDGNEGNNSVLRGRCDNAEEERVQRHRAIVPVSIQKAIFENDVSVKVGVERGGGFSSWKVLGQCGKNTGKNTKRGQRLQMARRDEDQMGGFSSWKSHGQCGKNTKRGQHLQMARRDEDQMGQAGECGSVISNGLATGHSSGGTKYRTTINQKKQQNTMPSVLHNPKSVRCISMAKKNNPADVDLHFPTCQYVAFKCKWCDLRNTSAQFIFAHQRILHKDKVLCEGHVSLYETWHMCLLCKGFLFTSRDMLLDHARKYHPSPIKPRTFSKQQGSVCSLVIGRTSKESLSKEQQGTVCSQMICGKSKESLNDKEVKKQQGGEQAGEEHVLTPTLADSSESSSCKKDANSICQLQKKVEDIGSKIGLSVRCNICKRHDKTPSELNVHVGEHLYKCYFCPEAFLGRNLIEHIIRNHWYCSYCKSVYRDRSHSLDHALNCKGSVFYCPHCAAKGKTLEWLKRHNAGHGNKCLHCKARFTRRVDRDEHVASDHCTDLHRYCRSCTNSASSSNVIQHHYAVAHGVFLQRCRYCNMLLHAERVISHEESHRYYTCVVCGLHFTRRTHWEGHMMRAHSKFKQMCGCCGESVKIHDFLKHECRHIRNLTEVDEVTSKDEGVFDSMEEDSLVVKPQIEPKANDIMQPEAGKHVRKKHKHKGKRRHAKKDKSRHKWYNCSACPMSFGKKKALRKHMKETRDECHQDRREVDKIKGDETWIALPGRDGSEFWSKDVDDLFEKQQTITSIVQIEKYPTLLKFLSDYAARAEAPIKPITIRPETLKSLVHGKRTIEDKNSDDSAVVAAVSNEKGENKRFKSS